MGASKSGFVQAPRSVRWREWLFQIHFWLGLIMGPIVAVIALTGSIVVFRYELNRVTVPGTAYVQPQSQRLSLDELTARIQAHVPKNSLSSASWDGGADTGINFWTTSPEGHRIHTFINPYTGEITGQEDYHEKWMQWFFDLHAYLLAGSTGEFLNGFIGTATLILSLSGLVIWWPGLPKWRSGFEFLRGARWQRQNYDWHKLIGFYSSLALAFVAFTGIYYCFPSLYKGVIERSTGKKVATTPKAKTEWSKRTVSIEDFVRAAERAQPGTSFTSLSFPKKPGDTVTVRTKETHDWHRIGLNYVYLEPADASLIRSARFSEANTATQAVLLFYPFHFGRFGGRWNSFAFYAVMVVYIIIGLAPPALMVTGLLMYWNRSLSKKFKRSRVAATVEKPVEVYR
jgi:uncharacterized iron-regulated membrane protein